MTSGFILNIRPIAISMVVAMIIPVVHADMNKAEQEQLQRLQRDVQILKRQVDGLNRSRRGDPRPIEIAAPAKSGNVSLGTNPTMGRKNAKIALIEFSDYQCPYCARFHAQTFNRIKKKFIDTGKVLYTYRDLPSPSRKQAVKAAIAARCAGAQKKYFDMQKMLFKNGSRLKDDSYVRFAKKLKLDMPKFEACLIDSNQTDRVEQDLIDGRVLGVRGTPTFFIGTIKGDKIVDASRLVGALPYNFFKQALDKALK